MILRCEECGMHHIVHKKMILDGLSCIDCKAGPLTPVGDAVMIGKRPSDIIIKTKVDASDLVKVQRMVDDIHASVDSMIEKLTEAKKNMKNETDHG